METGLPALVLLGLIRVVEADECRRVGVAVYLGSSSSAEIWRTTHMCFVLNYQYTQGPRLRKSWAKKIDMNHRVLYAYLSFICFNFYIIYILLFLILIIIIIYYYYIYIF